MEFEYSELKLNILKYVSKSFKIAHNWFSKSNVYVWATVGNFIMVHSRKIGLLYDFFSCKVINKYLVTILVSPNSTTSYCGHFFPEMWNVAANMYLATIMFTKMHEMKVVALPYKTLQIQGDPHRNFSISNYRISETWYFQSYMIVSNAIMPLYVSFSESRASNTVWLQKCIHIAI